MSTGGLIARWRAAREQPSTAPTPEQRQASWDAFVDKHTRFMARLEAGEQRPAQDPNVCQAVVVNGRALSVEDAIAEVASNIQAHLAREKARQEAERPPTQPVTARHLDYWEDQPVDYSWLETETINDRLDYIIRRTRYIEHERRMRRHMRDLRRATRDLEAISSNPPRLPRA